MTLQRLFTSTTAAPATNKKTDVLTPAQTAKKTDSNYGLSVSRNLCLQLLESFYDSVAAMSCATSNATAAAVVTGAGAVITSVTGNSASSMVEESSGARQSNLSSPSVLVSVLLACLTPLLPATGPESADTTESLETILISKIQAINLASDNDDGSDSEAEAAQPSSSNNNVNQDDILLLSSYLSRIVSLVLLILGHPFLQFNPALCSTSVTAGSGGSMKEVRGDHSSRGGRSRLSNILNLVSSRLLVTAARGPSTTSSSGAVSRRRQAMSASSSNAKYQLSDVLLCLSAVSRDYLCRKITAALYHAHSSVLRRAAQQAIVILIQHTYHPATPTAIPFSVGHQYVLSHILPSLITKLESAEVKHIPGDDLFKYLYPGRAREEFVARTEVKDDEIKITNADRMKDSSRGSRRGKSADIYVFTCIHLNWLICLFLCLSVCLSVGVRICVYV
jgi:hypothetical protein